MLDPSLPIPDSLLLSIPISTPSIGSPATAAKRPLPSSPTESDPKRHRLFNVDFTTPSPHLRCPTCRQLFSVPFALQRHVITVHSTAERFKCIECKRGFRRKDSLERHRAAHLKTGFVTCPGCMKAMRPDYLPTHLLARKNWKCALVQSLGEQGSATSSNSGDIAKPAETEDDFAEPNVAEADAGASLPTTQHEQDTDESTDSAVDSNAHEAHSEQIVRVTELTLPMQRVAAASCTAPSNEQLALTTYQSQPNNLEPDRRDPLLFELDQEDMSEFSEDLRAQIQQWSKLEASATYGHPDDLSSVALQVKKHIGRTHKPRNTSLSTECRICGLRMSTSSKSQVQHLAHHVQHGLQARFHCPICFVGFVFKRDFEQHRTHVSRGILGSECEQFTATFAGVWINEAIRDNFVQDLRIWERFQLYQYLDDVAATLDCSISKKLSAASLPDRFSDSSAIFARWSLSSYRSWGPSREHSRDAVEFEALTRQFESVSINQVDIDRGNGPNNLHQSNSLHDCSVALSSLALAVQLERAEWISLALKERSLCDKRCRERYALCLACLIGKWELVVPLLNAGIDPNEAGPSSLPVRPLTLAMVRDHRDVVKLLLERGAKVGDDSASYFLHAAKQNDVPVMRLMLKAGLSPDCTIAGEPLLILCARKGYEDAVVRLFDVGVSPNLRDSNKKSALHHASANGHAATVCCLLRNGALPDARITGFTASHGLTPLMLACRQGHWQVVAYLLQSKAEVHAAHPLGRTALHHACETGLPDSDAIVHHLLSAGANLNALDVSGTTPLMYAAASGSHHLVRDMLVCGADISVRADSGLDVLRMAKNCGHCRVIKTLTSWSPGSTGKIAI